MPSATAAGLSTGTHVLAPGTGQGGARELGREPLRAGDREESSDSPQISMTGRSKRGIASAASRRVADGNRPGRDEIVSHPWITSRRPEERFLALVVEPAAVTVEMTFVERSTIAAAAGTAAGEPGGPATHRRRLSGAHPGELVIVVTVGEDEARHPAEAGMTGGQRQQEQSTGCVVGDHRGVVDLEQLEAVEHQPSQRDRRPVRSRPTAATMRSQREIDRDAAVAVLERGDDVAPQIAIRERAGEEDERRPITGRSPCEGSEPRVKPLGSVVSSV